MTNAQQYANTPAGDMAREIADLRAELKTARAQYKDLAIGRDAESDANERLREALAEIRKALETPRRPERIRLEFENWTIESSREGVPLVFGDGKYPHDPPRVASPLEAALADRLQEVQRAAVGSIEVEGS